MKPIADCRLYTFVDAAYLHGRSAVEVARQLCEGGSDIIQLRAKEFSKTDVHRMAESILPITRAAGVPLVLNDHPDIALAVGTEFCHLGQEDFFNAGYIRVSDLLANLSACKRPPRESTLQMGLSTHAPEQARRAMDAKPAYIAIGPVFATGTKPAARPVTLDYVRWASENVSIPWFAIGGINLENLESVKKAGARRICVVSAILNRTDISEACREFRRQLES